MKDNMETTTMTLQSALKLKRRIITKIRDLKEKISAYNKYVAGQEGSKPFDLDNLISQYRSNKSDLVKLKTIITESNLPVMGHIHKLEELKDTVTFLRSIPCNPSNRGYNDEGVKYSVHFTAADVDKQINDVTDLICGIQDELDEYNHNTKIVVAF